jgi:nucleotide-binding universal stress UspA family protein
MKIIVGIDMLRAYPPALHLVARLGFRNPELLLVQTAPTIDSVLPPFPMDGATVDLMQSTFRDAGEAALRDAEADAKQFGLPAKKLYCVGPAAEILNQCVEEEQADLVAVRTTHQGAWQSEFMGSVTRTVMLCGHVSVLVAKQELVSDKPLHIVFATDGSEFNDRCLEKFLSWNASDIQNVHVVGAWGLASHLEELLRHALHHSAEVNAKLESAAEAAVAKTASKFEAAGYKTSTQTAQGLPDQVLHDVMRRTNADLLVVGAQGKNWIERLLIGSTSLHQVIDESYNVLLIRP